MIDHVGFPVSDYERSKAFYARALAPLGYMLIKEYNGDKTEIGASAAGFGADGKPDFWIGGEGGLTGVLHVAIVAKDRATVDSSTAPRSRPAARTTAHRDCGRNIIPTTTAPSCLIPTATMSRRSVTVRLEPTEPVVTVGG
jgi:catechol 2,3-dioxygenase-like lactoylglutathione lyase family enzyme